MDGFKGFFKELVCDGGGLETISKQYKEDTIFEEKEEINPGKKGMHFCNNLLRVFNYYPPMKEICEPSEYARVTALGEIKQSSLDKMYCTDKLKINDKISIIKFIESYFMKVAQKVFEIVSKTKASKVSISDENFTSTASLEAYSVVQRKKEGCAFALKDGSCSFTSNDYSIAFSSGNRSDAIAQGDCSVALTYNETNDGVAITHGNFSLAASEGHYGIAVSMGDLSLSQSNGQYGVAIASGFNSEARTTGYAGIALSSFPRGSAATEKISWRSNWLLYNSFYSPKNFSKRNKG